MPEIESSYRYNDGWRVQHVLKKEAPIWNFDLFGDGAIIFLLDKPVSKWKRFWTRFFFGSRWEDIS